MDVATNVKDNEIIKALKKHSMDLCSNCKVEKTTLCNNCISEIERKALDLINRLQAEIERLDKELIEEKLRKEMLHYTVEEIKANAIKEFAERLKEHQSVIGEDPIFGQQIYVSVEWIDNLVKEMIGGTE